MVSYDLLASIFQPGSPLHDGAAIIQGDRVAAAACFLPLSVNPRVSRELGTRHRAALGLTEENDAVAIVVSEETGSISLVIGGDIERGISADVLWTRLRSLTGRRRMRCRPRRDAELARLMAYPGFRHLGLKFISIALAALLWLVVSGEQIVERALRIPLEFTNLPAQLEMVGEPLNVADVRIRGSSGALSRVASGELVAVLDLRIGPPRAAAVSPCRHGRARPVRHRGRPDRALERRDHVRGVGHARSCLSCPTSKVIRPTDSSSAPSVPIRRRSKSSVPRPRSRR